MGGLGQHPPRGSSCSPTPPTALVSTQSPTPAPSRPSPFLRHFFIDRSPLFWLLSHRFIFPVLQLHINGIIQCAVYIVCACVQSSPTLLHQAVLKLRNHLAFLLSFSPSPLSPILWMRKRRLREVKGFAQSHIVSQLQN